ncbi:MAG: class II aldolase/adducin family protein [Planctomycetota bacterium]
MKSKWNASENIIRLFQNVGRALLLYDAEDSHSGNIAMRFRDDAGKDRIAITSTGSQKGDLEPNHICILSATKTDSGYYKASSETDVHARILSIDGVSASLHAHTKDLIIVTLDDDDKPSRPGPFVPIDPLGYYMLDGMVPVDWVEVPSGGTDMAEKIPARLQDHKATLIQGHGTFTRGRTVQEAFYRICIANNSGYIVRLLERLGVDVEPLRRKIEENAETLFSYPPTPYTVDDDDRCDFPHETEIIHEFRKTGARIFESRISPFHTGSLSVRGIKTMLYAPKASMPRDLPGPLLEIPLGPDASDLKEIEIHKAIYASGNFQTIAHCYVPEAEVLANYVLPWEKDLPTRVVPIDAEGSFLYLVIPVVPHDVEIDTLTHLLHDYKVVIVRGGGVWGVGMQSLSEVLHHPSSVREVCLYRIGAFERGLNVKKLEPKKAEKW